MAVKYDHRESFFRSTQPAVILAQYFSLFPSLSGLNGKTHRNLKNNWFSLKMLYAVYAITGNFCILWCVMNSFWSKPLNYDIFSSIFFYLSCLMIFIAFFSLNKSWIKLNDEFVLMEIMFKRHGYTKCKLKLKLFLIAFMSAAAVEHFSGVIKVLFRAISCAKSSNVYDILEEFFKLNYHKVFMVFDYHFILGVLLFHINVLCTFWWNFLDVILITISTYLSSRFGQFNSYLSRHQSKSCSTKFWQRAREEYNCLAQLTKKVDRYMGHLIALSFLGNIVVICQQLLRNLHSRKYGLQKFYFVWSFGYLLTRTAVSALSMAEVHNRSKLCKSTLFSVPAQSYCKDVERFLLQLESDNIALTGFGFFVVSRRVLLTIAGTILTYEIVLLQFNSAIEMDNWSTVANHTICL